MKIGNVPYHLICFLSIFVLQKRNSSMIELFLTRHGETVENRKRVLQGHLPGQLTVEGIRQAEQLRERLKGFP